MIDNNLELYLCTCMQFFTYSLLPFVFYIIRQANVADYADNQWVTCFQESAEAILGQNAAYLGQLKDSVRSTLLNIILASGKEEALLQPDMHPHTLVHGQICLEDRLCFVSSRHNYSDTHSNVVFPHIKLSDNCFILHQKLRWNWHLIKIICEAFEIQPIKCFFKFQNETAFDEIFQQANFNTFVFRSRVKLETYNVSRAGIEIVWHNVYRFIAVLK